MQSTTPITQDTRGLLWCVAIETPLPPWSVAGCRWCRTSSATTPSTSACPTTAPRTYVALSHVTPIASFRLELLD